MLSEPRVSSGSARLFRTNPASRSEPRGVSLLELTSAYAAVASGRYPVAARGLPRSAARSKLCAASFMRAARSTNGATASPMLDLLYAAANEGTGRRAALRGSNLWKDRHHPGEPRCFVCRLRRRSGRRHLGRPRRQRVAWQGQRRDGPGADLAELHELRASRRSLAGAALPVGFEPDQQRHQRSQSPLPPEWSNSTKPLRQLVQHLQDLVGDDRH